MDLIRNLKVQIMMVEEKLCLESNNNLRLATLYKSLMINLQKKRENHIINNMLYMVEINSENKIKLFDLFGKNANIIINDFLSNQQNLFTEINGKKMDFNIIIGNPPYNSQGNIKGPTNHQSKKKEDGKSRCR